jgi:tetratricopeptide (TPR) repeat protein
MPTRTYMVIDERRDHSFRPPRPDLSVKLGIPNACNDCHTKPEETFQWAADAVRKWYGEKRADDPHWAEAIAAARKRDPLGEKLLLELIERRQTPPIVRATAIDLLTNYPSPASAAARRAALEDTDPIVRATAARSVVVDLDPATIAKLAALLSDPIRAVRMAAVVHLAQVPIQYIPDSQRSALEQAMIEIRDVQSLSLDHAGGHLSLAVLDRGQCRVDRAMSHLEAAIKLEPYLAGPRGELASLLQSQAGSAAEIRKLRKEEAELMDRDARLAPENAQIQYQLGLLRYLLDEYDKATEALSAATRLAPQNYDYLLALALLQERRYEVTGGKPWLDAAIESLKKMNALAPNDPRAQQILTRLLETTRAKEARKGS